VKNDEIEGVIISGILWDISFVAAVKHQCIVVSSSSSDNVNSQTCPQRGRPQKSHSNVDETDSSPLLALDEYNVGPVLEKLLAMMQSMSMLLSALKNDLRHSNMPEVVAKKRDAATTQLWRAFVAYQKSFSEIEQFAGLSKLPDESVHVSTTSQSSVKRDVAVKSAGRSQRVQVRETDVIELSESESDEDVECKRPRYDAAATAERSAPSSVSSAAVESPQTYLQRPGSWGRATAGRQDVVSHVHTANAEGILTTFIQPADVGSHHLEY